MNAEREQKRSEKERGITGWSETKTINDRTDQERTRRNIERAGQDQKEDPARKMEINSSILSQMSKSVTNR